MKIIIPSYLYPSKEWARMLKKKPWAVIVNPSNGPGEKTDPNYEAVAGEARRANVKVIGYVPLGWAKNRPEKIKRDYDKHAEWYGVRGVFFDEAPTSPENIPFVREAIDRRGLTVLNHGTHPDEKYAKLNAVLVTYETDYDSYMATEPPDWVHRYPAQKFFHIVHSVPDVAAARKAAATAKRRNAGYFWATDDKMGEDGNPYNKLPAFYEKMFRFV